MIVCVSPVLYNAEETFCSLNFASRLEIGLLVGLDTRMHALRWMPPLVLTIVIVPIVKTLINL
jgi:hypothetical protein